jgi:hypothetical protein
MCLSLLMNQQEERQEDHSAINESYLFTFARRSDEMSYQS